MAEESKNKLIPTDEVIDAKIVSALEEPLRKISEHDKSLAGKAEISSVYDKTTVDSKVKELGDAVAEHVANDTRHIADGEREIWNNKPDSSEIYTRQQSDQRFAYVSHEHASDGWFVSAINAVKALIPAIPSWLTPTREEPPTKDEVASKYTKPNSGIPETDMTESVKMSLGLANTALHATEYSTSSVYTVGQYAFHDGNIYQCTTAIDSGEEWNPYHWSYAQKLDDFFTESNSLLEATIDARLPYPLYAVSDETGLLKDRAINTTSLASVTVPENFTDLLVRASVGSSLAVTMPEAIATKYGDTFPSEAGEYLITITKTGAAEAYVRTIKLEEVA